MMVATPLAAYTKIKQKACFDFTKAKGRKDAKGQGVKLCLACVLMLAFACLFVIFHVLITNLIKSSIYSSPSSNLISEIPPATKGSSLNPKRYVIHNS